jgi:hypothetical protein
MAYKLKQKRKIGSSYRFKFPPISSVKTKGEARNLAITYQSKISNEIISWGEVANYSHYFETLGKKFKLTEEFKENGII